MNQLFREYIAEKIDQHVMEAYEVFGFSYIQTSGHFVHYLWNGDVDGMFAHADSKNLKWLEEKLGITKGEFSRFWNIPIPEGKEGIRKLCRDRGYGDGDMVTWQV